MLPPIQRERLAFDRPYEAGLQWLFQGARLEHDLWLHWQRVNTAEHRERLDGGARLQWRLAHALALPLQVHIVHEGGQLYGAGPVRDSVAVASGIVLSKTAKPEEPAPPAGSDRVARMTGDPRAAGAVVASCPRPAAAAEDERRRRILRPGRSGMAGVAGAPADVARR